MLKEGPSRKHIKEARLEEERRIVQRVYQESMPAYNRAVTLRDSLDLFEMIQDIAGRAEIVAPGEYPPPPDDSLAYREWGIKNPSWQMRKKPTIIDFGASRASGYQRHQVLGKERKINVHVATGTEFALVWGEHDIFPSENWKGNGIWIGITDNKTIEIVGGSRGFKIAIDPSKEQGEEIKLMLKKAIDHPQKTRRCRGDEFIPHYGRLSQ